MLVTPKVLEKLLDIYFTSSGRDIWVTSYNIQYPLKAKYKVQNQILYGPIDIISLNAKDILQIEFNASGFPESPAVMYNVTCNYRNITTDPVTSNNALINFTSAILQVTKEDIVKNVFNKA
jgi:hypothetical protein